jgi:carbonic anhydrase/acetyltransferase-like protein (isoleucine patch superfamily)
MLHAFEGKEPVIGKGSYVSESAVVIGDVHIGERCFIAPGAVIRGDYGSIRIGDGTAVEDNAVIHARPGETTTIGKRVTIGHGAIIHTPVIEDNAVIGMGAIVSDFAHVGEWAAIGEGAVVRNRQDIPAESIAVGVPAKTIGKVDDTYKEQWSRFKSIYEELASERYPKGLKRV